MTKAMVILTVLLMISVGTNVYVISSGSDVPNDALMQTIKAQEQDRLEKEKAELSSQYLKEQKKLLDKIEEIESSSKVKIKENNVKLANSIERIKETNTSGIKKELVEYGISSEDIEEGNNKLTISLDGAKILVQKIKTMENNLVNADLECQRNIAEKTKHLIPKYISEIYLQKRDNIIINSENRELKAENAILKGSLSGAKKDKIKTIIITAVSSVAVSLAAYAMVDKFALK